MKTSIAKSLVASAAFAFFSSTSLAADTYQIDPSHANITWQVSHFGFSSPSGKFATVEGTLSLDEAKPENSKVSVKISTASVISGVEKLDTHLKTADFFNVEKFPTATFESTKVSVTGKDTAKVEGNLTLLGVTKPVVLDVKLNKIGENMMKKKTAGFSASTTLKRSDFGMNYAVPAVSDDVKISIEAEANI